MRTSRRGFLKTLGGVALFSIVPRHVLGNGYIAPSDQLTKGIIGTGGMGRGHVGYAGTRLVAVCDVDKNHLELGKKLVKEKIAAYHDFRDLILDPNVDIVHIATPPHWHGIMSVEAAKAGKDIWCEKPMTRTIGEGKRVMEAVQQYGRMFRLNTWFRFTDQFYGLGTPVKPLKKLVQSGLLGWPLKVTISAATGFTGSFSGWVKNILNRNRFRLSWIMICGWARLLISLIMPIVYIRLSVDIGIMTEADSVTWGSTISIPYNIY